MAEFDLTPNPRVLVALTHTPLQPLDALCELIDNALDSFRTARLEGQPVEYPMVIIDLPGASEVARGEGLVRVRDNGPGLTPNMAENALKAGFSGNDSFDSLGLFGMGFNISTGKLGRKTRFVTARATDANALEVVVDLVELQEAGHYKVPVKDIDKPTEFTSGTIVEVSSWWPEGNPNSGFVKKLASYQKARVREEIGRRYATILREENVRIFVNGETCAPFEHCVWDSTRHVERRGHGQIPARFSFDEVVGNQTRCTECHALIKGEEQCPACGSSHFRTLEQRIRGWVGMQRFDDQTLFGIDLIRNGRAIRVWEKPAFFEYTDELKDVVRDYPIDSIYGRIVGEVHLNHVPVDFMKQDFQRSTPEWQQALVFLRGESSLQPTRPGASENRSPIYKLYQGYRKIRRPGTADMYMGVWDPGASSPRRVSRDLEKEYYQKFLEKEPGYHDDAEWWHKVEEADRPPLDELINCPECGGENLKTQEECNLCGHVLIGKECINPDCRKTLPRSAAACPYCETSQIPEIEEPWACEVCAAPNASDSERCLQCDNPRGTPSLTSRDFLIDYSEKDDALSASGLSVQLADDDGASIEVDTFVTRGPIYTSWQGPTVPVYPLKGERIEVFVDRSHPLFTSYRARPEELVAAEVAQYLYDANRRLLTPKYQGLHTISNLVWRILERRWSDELEDSPDRISEDIDRLFDMMRERLPGLVSDRAPDVFDDLTDGQKKALVGSLLGRGQDISQLGQLRDSGSFLAYVDEDTIVDIFRRTPAVFFDGGLWSDAYTAPVDLSDAVLEDYQSRIRDTYLNCLEDCAAFLKYRHPEPLIAHRARTSIDFLSNKLE